MKFASILLGARRQIDLRGRTPVLFGDAQQQPARANSTMNAEPQPAMDILSTPEMLDRINALVARATGVAVEADRMHTDALYARDVLLVCDALTDSDGPALAKRFRALVVIKNSAAETHAKVRRNPVGAPSRAERRAKGLRDRRHQHSKSRPPPGRDRRRGPRRSADGESSGPAPQAGGIRPATTPRVFGTVFGQTTQPPDEDIAPEQTDASPLRRWFGRRPGPR